VEWVRGVSLLPMRVIRRLPPRVQPTLHVLANRAPQLCSNFMALATRR
jgi:hypothetical protein